MESQKERVLTLFISFINQNHEYFGLEKGKKFNMKSFDNLTSDTFQKMLTLILDELKLSEDENVLKTEFRTLTGMSEQNNPVTYENTIDQLYWNIKKYYPKEDNSFEYKLLFFPKPKIVKEIIYYLSSLSLFFSSAIAQYKEIGIQVEEKIKAKFQYYNELEEAKAAINSKMIELESRKDEIPKFEEEISQKQDKLQEGQEEIAELENEASRYKKTYEYKDTMYRESKRTFESFETEIIALEEKLVSSPSSIIHELNIEKGLYNNSELERNEIGNELSKLSGKEQILKTLNDEAIKLMSNIRAIISQLELVCNYSNDYSSQSQACKLIRKEIQSKDFDKEKMLNNKESKIQDREKKQEKFSKEVENLSAQLDVLKLQLTKLESEYNNKRQKSSELNAKIDNLDKLLREIFIEIQNYLDFCDIDVPKRLNALEKLFEEAVEEFNDEVKCWEDKYNVHNSSRRI